MVHTNLQPSPYAIFRRRDFRWLFGAQFVSSAGSGLTTIAASILVFQVTGSAMSVGLMLMATALPSLAVGLIAGVFVDRFDRRRIMVVAQVLRALLVGAIPLALAMGVVWVYLLVALSSTLESFFAPAQSSILPDLAPDDELAAANALMTVSDCAALTIGYAGAGLLASTDLIAWAFWLDALSYLVAAGCLAQMRIPSSAVDAETSVAAVVQNLHDGLAYVRDTPVLRSLFLVFIPIFAVFGFENALMLPFATRALNATEFEYGLLEAIFTVGFVVAGLGMVLVTERLHAGQWVAGSILLMGFAGVAFALAPSIWPALAINAVLGLLNTPSYVGRTLIIQRNTPREARGRVTGAFAVVRDGLFLLGMAGGGLADVFDTRLLLLASVTVLIASGAFALVLPGLGQPSIEWRRAWRMLRTAPQSAELGLGRAALMADIERLLTVLPALGEMDHQQRQALAEAARIHTLRAGTTVVRRGESSDAVYFVLDGRTVALAGEEQGDILETHAAGGFFGEIAALTSVPRTATVIAEQPTILLQAPAAVLRQLVSDPRLNRLFLSKLAERMVRMQLIDLPRHAGFEQGVLRDLRMVVPQAHLPVARAGAT